MTFFLKAKQAKKKKKKKRKESVTLMVLEIPKYMWVWLMSSTFLTKGVLLY